MILIFGNSMIFWTGILTGFLFILSFFGCCSNLNLCKGRSFDKLRRYHKLSIYLALIFFLIHATLAILSRFGVLV